MLLNILIAVTIIALIIVIVLSKVLEKEVKRDDLIYILELKSNLFPYYITNGDTWWNYNGMQITQLEGKPKGVD